MTDEPDPTYPQGDDGPHRPPPRLPAPRRKKRRPPPADPKARRQAVLAGDFGTTPTARQLTKAERYERIMELRVLGRSLADIAREFGVSRARIHQILQEIHHAYTTRYVEKMAHHVQMELLRLDRLWAGVSEKAFQGYRWEVELALKIMERRASLLGLDAPKKLIQANVDAEDISDAELLEEARRLGLPAPRPLRLEDRHRDYPLPGEVLDAEVVPPAVGVGGAGPAGPPQGGVLPPVAGGGPGGGGEEAPGPGPAPDAGAGEPVPPVP